MKCANHNPPNVKLECSNTLGTSGSKTCLWLKGALPSFHTCHVFVVSECSPKQDLRCRIRSMKFLGGKKKKRIKRFIFKFAPEHSLVLVLQRLWLKGEGPLLSVGACSKFKSNVNRRKLYSPHPQKIVSHSSLETIASAEQGADVGRCAVRSLCWGWGTS